MLTRLRHNCFARLKPTQSWYDGSGTYYLNSYRDLRDFFKILSGEISENYKGIPIKERSFKGETIYLNRDIDLKNKPFVPGYSKNATAYSATNRFGFSGVFDGQGHCISNMNISIEDETSTEHLGFFSGLYGATIKNLNFVNANVNNKGTGYAGVLCGGASCTAIENCHVKSGIVIGSSVTGGVCGYSKFSNSGYNDSIFPQTSNNLFLNCSNYATVQGGDYVGGIVGYMARGSHGLLDEYLVGCVNDANVTGVSLVGGICGNAYGIYESVAIRDCINLGKISGDEGIGGIVGEVHSTYTNSVVLLKVHHCINVGEIIAKYNAGGIIGQLPNTSNNYVQINQLLSLGNIKVENDYAGGIIGWMPSSQNVKLTVMLAKVVANISSDQVESSSANPIAGCGSISSLTVYDTSVSYNCGTLTGDCGTQDTTLTKESFKTLEALSYFDFENIWDLTDKNNGYPSLKWQNV